MELEQSNTSFEPVDDKRPRIEQPLPVQLVAVADCVLTAVAGMERDLDKFYVGLLGFEREEGEAIIYRAENFRLHFTIAEIPPKRDDYLSLGIIVESLDNVMRQLTEREIEFTRQQKLAVGSETISLNDPAGNLIEIGQILTAI